jgi:N-carbamoylputrescine amidase
MARFRKPFRIALAQLQCSSDSRDNIASAEDAVSAASRRAVDLCVLPEMFTNLYLGQFQDAKAALAEVPNHRILLASFAALAKQRSIALVIPFVERVARKRCYNALALVDRHGFIQARYRKIHIPRGEGYREDLYFTPGNLGYAVARVGSVRIGLAICWDQWFPEVSRALALQGADVIVYPSAIGSEIVKPDFDSRPSWELVMRAQAVMNRTFVVAVNRVGHEERIRFYGGSFVADPWGRVLRRASTERSQTLIVSLDIGEISKANSFFGFFDTRSPETYGILRRRIPRRHKPARGTSESGAFGSGGTR